MKIITRIFIISIASIGILFGFLRCDDIFEDDISTENISLYAPSDSIVTKIITHTFWWEEVEGADEYNLQIVTPDFPRSFT